MGSWDAIMRAPSSCNMAGTSTMSEIISNDSRCKYDSNYDLDPRQHDFSNL
jgi:hypothetical protein